MPSGIPEEVRLVPVFLAVGLAVGVKVVGLRPTVVSFGEVFPLPLGVVLVGAPVVVVAGGASSYAPASHALPVGRGTPRASAGGHPAAGAAPIAALFAASACVATGPPLLPSGESPGSPAVPGHDESVVGKRTFPPPSVIDPWVVAGEHAGASFPEKTLPATEIAPPMRASALPPPIVPPPPGGSGAPCGPVAPFVLFDSVRFFISVPVPAALAIAPPSPPSPPLPPVPTPPAPLRSPIPAPAPAVAFPASPPAPL